MRRPVSLSRLLALAALLASVATGCPGDPPASVDGGMDSGAPADDFHDPLATPAEPTHSVGSFSSASVCQPCHEAHFAQWKTSMHAYAMIDPVFRALVAVRQADYDGAQDQFCTQCHSAIATRGGEIVPGFSFDELSEVVLEGVTCEACHKASEVRRDHNSGLLLDPDGPLRATIPDPIENPAHASEYSPVHGTSTFCASCHDVVEVSDLNLERPYEEWLESPAFIEGRTCQTCHMPSYTGNATEGAPVRSLHEHWFVGVDLPLTEGFVTPEELDAGRVRVLDLLSTAAALATEAPDSVVAGQQLDLLVTVQNLIDGHNLPTGSTFVRQVWLEVLVTDAAGAVLYETGTLDGNGDLRDHFSELDPYGDDDLVTFGSRFLSPEGEPEVFSWRAAEHISNSIPPLHQRTSTLFIPTEASTVGPLAIEARLRFRTHPPFLLRRLGLDEYLPAIGTYDLATSSRAVEVVAP